MYVAAVEQDFPGRTMTAALAHTPMVKFAFQALAWIYDRADYEHARLMEEAASNRRWMKSIKRSSIRWRMYSLALNEGIRKQASIVP